MDELIKDLRENHDKYFARDMEAADAIEALEIKAETFKSAYIAEHNARIDEIKRHMWIPVTERLPEMHEEVLVCDEDYGKTGLGFSEVAVWDGSDWICAWDMESRLYCINHWMPLPEPPKEKENE